MAESVIRKAGLTLIVVALVCVYFQTVSYIQDASFSSSSVSSVFRPERKYEEDKQMTDDGQPNVFLEAVGKYALNGTIVITSFDITYLPMALNLFLTSLQRFNISNHLFVATDHLACQQLVSYGAHCVQYVNLSLVNKPSYFNQPDYNKKTCIKPKLILDCLRAGYDTLLVDLDIVFMKNPLPVIDKCKDCDLIAQTDPATEDLVSGLYLVRHTTGSVKLFTKCIEMMGRCRRGDQIYLNEAVKNLSGSITLERLNPQLFPLGNWFFEIGRRMFLGDNPCNECILVHNNYIISLEAKIYRFKEYGMWMVDLDGYYSDKRRKYIKYGNPIDFSLQEGFGSNDTTAMEVVSLKAALMIGRILNRTVILPKFHCRQKCHLGCRFSVRKFESILPVLELYRESVFLEHPLVPESTKNSISQPYVISSPIWQQLAKVDKSQTTGVRVLKPEGLHVSENDIRHWFGSEPARVLNFYSLYNEIYCDSTDLLEYRNKVERGIVASTPLQRV